MIDSDIQKLIGGVKTDSKGITYAYFYFFKIKEK
jgi:hypothetical protein